MSKLVFADAHYWIATVNKNDQWHAAARAAKQAVGPAVLVTTDEVLVEFLTALGNREHLRQLAGRMVRAILQDPNVRVLPQSRHSFLQGVQLYEQRPDKDYSLTDCISICTMSSESIAEVLTNDHHFEQEGFTVLIKPVE